MGSARDRNLRLEENVLGIKARVIVRSPGVAQPVTQRKKQLPLEVLSNPVFSVMLVQEKKGLLQSSIAQPSFHIFPYPALHGALLSAQAY